MAERKAISTKTRFEIFKRDGFVCQYCGAHPPQATLHVDHIVAVASGGGNQMDNLVTACDLCNMGKGARDLKVATIGLAEKSDLIKEREKQLKGYYKIMEAARQRVNDEIWQVIWAFDEKSNTFRRDWIQSIKAFIERLGFYEVLDAMEKARAKCPWHETPRFKYFCGVCWNKIRTAEGEK